MIKHRAQQFAALTEADLTKGVIVIHAIEGILLGATGICSDQIYDTTDSILEMVRADNIFSLLQFTSNAYAISSASRDAVRVLFTTITMGHHSDSLRPFLRWLKLKLIAAFCKRKLPVNKTQSPALSHISNKISYTVSSAATDAVSDALSNALSIANASLNKDLHLSTDDLKLSKIIAEAETNAKYISGHEKGELPRNSAYLIQCRRVATQFQSLILPYLTDRSLFLTTAGNIGLAPRTTKIEDQIWFLSGARTPMILRPLGNNGHFQVVGEAYLTGFMDGRICKTYQQAHLHDIFLV